MFIYCGFIASFLLLLFMTLWQVTFICFVIFSTQLLLLNKIKALDGLLCADVPLRN